MGWPAHNLRSQDLIYVTNSSTSSSVLVYNLSITICRSVVNYTTWPERIQLVYTAPPEGWYGDYFPANGVVLNVSQECGTATGIWNGSKTVQFVGGSAIPTYTVSVSCLYQGCSSEIDLRGSLVVPVGQSINRTCLTASGYRFNSQPAVTQTCSQPSESEATCSNVTTPPYGGLCLDVHYKTQGQCDNLTLVGLSQCDDRLGMLGPICKPPIKIDAVVLGRLFVNWAVFSAALPQGQLVTVTADSTAVTWFELELSCDYDKTILTSQIACTGYVNFNVSKRNSEKPYVDFRLDISAVSLFCVENVSPLPGVAPCGTLNFGANCYPVCEKNFYRNFSSYRTCQANGSYTPGPTPCTPYSCHEPPSLGFGNASCDRGVDYNAVCTLSCENGFYLVGTPHVTCNQGVSDLVYYTLAWSEGGVCMLCALLSGALLQPYWLVVLSYTVIVLLALVYRLCNGVEHIMDFDKKSLIIIYVQSLLQIVHYAYILVTLDWIHDSQSHWERYQELGSRVFNSGIPSIFFFSLFGLLSHKPCPGPPWAKYHFWPSSISTGLMLVPFAVTHIIPFVVIYCWYFAIVCLLLAGVKFLPDQMKKKKVSKNGQYALMVDHLQERRAVAFARCFCSIACRILEGVCAVLLLQTSFNCISLFYEHRFPYIQVPLIEFNLRQTSCYATLLWDNMQNLVSLLSSF